MFLETLWNIFMISLPLLSFPNSILDCPSYGIWRTNLSVVVNVFVQTNVLFRISPPFVPRIVQKMLAC